MRWGFYIWKIEQEWENNNEQMLIKLFKNFQIVSYGDDFNIFIFHEYFMKIMEIVDFIN